METVEKRPLTTRDKLAGLVALCLMAGFVVDPIQYVAATALSLLFHPLTAVFPFSALLSGVGSATGLVSAVLTVRLVDDDRVDRLGERVETLRERLTSEDPDDVGNGDDTGDADDADDPGPELATAQLELLKTQFRPAIYSALVTVPAFLWLRWVFAAPGTALAPAVVVLPAVGPVAWSATLVGPLKVWLAWYLGASVSTRLVAGRAIRRLDLV